MRREPLKYIFLTLVSIFLLVEIALLLSGRRILLHEKFDAGHDEFVGLTSYVPKEEGTFECTYWTGRKKVHQVLYANNYAECPFIWNEG